MVPEPREALAAKGKQRPAAAAGLRNAMLALIPNPRAFAFSLCGSHEHADDLVQETLRKAWGHSGSFAAPLNTVALPCAVHFAEAF